MDKITKKQKKTIDKVIKKMWTPKDVKELNNVNFNIYLKDKLKDSEFKKEYDKVKLSKLEDFIYFLSYHDLKELISEHKDTKIATLAVERYKMGEKRFKDKTFTKSKKQIKRELEEELADALVYWFILQQK